MKRVARGLATLLCGAAIVVVVIVVVVPALFGLQRYVITGGSMTGSIPKGSVVYERQALVTRLRVGDIITFAPPGYAAPVTHRIVSVTPGQDGRPVFQTKGDANSAVDPWKVNLSGPTQARYAFHLPYVGYFLAALAIRQVRIVLIGIPAILIAVSLLWSLWRQAGDDVRDDQFVDAARQTEGEA